MSNNKQQTAVEQMFQEMLEIQQSGKTLTFDENLALLKKYKEMEKEQKRIQLPSDEEIEEKLNVAYGNGYEQGEMDFYKKMQGKGNQYADGYAEGYLRALELVKFQIVEQLEARR